MRQPMSMAARAGEFPKLSNPPAFDAPRAPDPVFLLVAHGQPRAVAACLAHARRHYPSATILVHESGTAVLRAVAARFGCDYTAGRNLLQPGPRSRYAHFHAAADLADWLGLFEAAARRGGWVVYLEPDVLVRGALRAFPAAAAGGKAHAFNRLLGGKRSWVAARRDRHGAAPRGDYHYATAGGCCLRAGPCRAAVAAAVADAAALFAAGAGGPWHGDELLSAVLLAEGFDVADWWELTEEEHETDAFRRAAAPLLHNFKHFYGGDAAPALAKPPPAAAALLVYSVGTDAGKVALYEATAARHGVATTAMLGLGGAWRGPDITKGPSGGFKFELLRAALAAAADDALVVFTDSYDVYWNAPLPDAAALAAILARRGCSLLFAAETRCWPTGCDGSDYPRPAADDRSPYRYLNSGCFLGRAATIKKLVAGVAADDDDQRRCHAFYAAEVNSGSRDVQIDATCELFQCLGGVETLPRGELELRGGRFGDCIANARYGTVPVAVHGNGGRSVKRSWEALARHHLVAAAQNDAAPSGGLAVRAVCLAGRCGRWVDCAAHLAGALPGADVAISPAVDGAGVVARAGAAPRDVAAVEAALDCGVWTGWAVADAAAAARACGEAVDSDDDAWRRFRALFVRGGWSPKCVEGYASFHTRHVTLGELGCALSHVRLWDDARSRDDTLVLEDDARLQDGCRAALDAALGHLRTARMPWDLVYVHSALYDVETVEVEVARGPTWRLVEAAHRKLTTAYAVSRRGAATLAASGFRASLFSVDDFLPALFGRGHPRPDVMALACVRRVRQSGFAAFALLGLEAPLCDVAIMRTGSDTARSPCVVGDYEAPGLGPDGAEPARPAVAVAVASDDAALLRYCREKQAELDAKLGPPVARPKRKKKAAAPRGWHAGAAPMAWWPPAAPVVVFDTPVQLCVVGKSGAIVRAAPAKDSAFVIKVGAGMHCVADAACGDRVRLAQPLPGWASRKLFVEADLSRVEREEAPREADRAAGTAYL